MHTVRDRRKNEEEEDGEGTKFWALQAKVPMTHA